MEHRQTLLLELIELIYGLVQNPSLWPELFRRLDDFILLTDHRDEATDAPVVVDEGLEKSVLYPHLQRALQLQRQLSDLQHERDVASSILDQLPIGVVLVDENLEVVAHNRYADKVFQADGVVRIKDFRLHAGNSADTGKIRKAVNYTLNPAGTAEVPTSLLFASGHTGSCSVHVSPTPLGTLHERRKVVAIFISSTDVRHFIDVDILADTYQLTRAEGRLLQALLNASHSLTEVADTLNISKHTARTQFKSILAKTNTHSQTELIKQVLMSSTALISREQSVPKTRPALDSAPPKPAAATGDYTVMTLADGRLLEYREYGDPSGIPVLFLHGFFHSRQMLHPTSRYVENNHIRLIMPQRPGFGASSLLPDKHPGDTYAQDIAQLAGFLGIDRFHLLTDTSGGRYGIICAYFLPHMVRRLAMVSLFPEPRFDIDTAILKPLNLMFRAYQKLPAFSRNHIAALVFRHLSENPDSYLNRMLDQMPLSDQQVVTSAVHRAIVAEVFEFGYQRNPRGLMDDVLQRIIPWPFDVSDCQVETQIWHGVENIIVDLNAVKNVARALPRGRLLAVEKHGHFLSISHWDEILATLISAS